MTASFTTFFRRSIRRPTLTIVGLAVACSVSGSWADTVTVRADPWYPFNGTPGDDKPGFMIEIAERALALGGHTLDYATAPWSRAIQDVREGQIDCVVGAYKAEAPDLVYPDIALARDSNHVFVRTDDPWRYEGPASLETIKFAGISGYSYGDDIDALIKRAPPNLLLTHGENALERAIRMLERKRVDAVIESALVFRAKTAQLGLQDAFRIAGDISAADDIHIGCSPAKPSSTAYVKLLGDGLRAMRSSGELATILGRYGLTDWAPDSPQD